MLDGQVPGVQPPVSSTWTAVNAGGSAFSDANGAIKFTGVNDGSSVVFRGAAQAWPSGTTTTNTVDGSIEHIGIATSGTSYATAYIGMLESATGKMLLIGSVYAVNSPTGTGGVVEVSVDTYSSSTTRTANTAYAFPLDNGPTFFRVQRASGTIAVQISRDRQNWLTLASFTTTTVFTTAPDQYAFGSFGFGCVPNFLLLSMAAS